MIDAVAIKNFKCFENELIPLKPLTVLSGINGAGKSSFMQSLLLLRQSVLESYKEVEIRLNGSLVSLGYSDDVLYENAKSNEAIELGIVAQENQQIFSFDYEKGQQTLKCKDPKNSKSYSGPLFENNFFYLNAERIGPRASFASNEAINGRINVIGNAGEYCAWLLAKNERRPIGIEALMHYSESINELRNQVEAWLSEIGQTARIHLDEHPSMDRVSMQFSFLRDGLPSNNYRPTNVGFGLTYALPIFVSALLSRPGGMLCIENPEAHLHPRAQSAMGRFLALVAKSGVQVIVETHSDHLLNGIRIATKQSMIDPSNVALHFFHRKEGAQSTSFVTPQLDYNGRLDGWPEGFFDEWENGLTELL
jgi:predicted ATPase